MAADYLLYGHPDSGHSYKVALALTLLGADWEHREVEVFAPRQARRSDWRAVSPYGEIPVLVTGGRALAQSDAILLHLARTTGRLDGEGDLDLVAQWLFWEANRIGFSLPNFRLYTWEGFASPGDPALLRWIRERLEADLDHLDAVLAARSFLLGPAVSVVDCACCGYLYFADQAGLNLARWPEVAAWLERIRALPGWKHPYDLMKA